MSPWRARIVVVGGELDDYDLYVVLIVYDTRQMNRSIMSELYVSIIPPPRILHPTTQ